MALCGRALDHDFSTPSLTQSVHLFFFFMTSPLVAPNGVVASVEFLGLQVY